jgi:hypothetical protein
MGTMDIPDENMMDGYTGWIYINGMMDITNGRNKE